LCEKIRKDLERHTGRLEELDAYLTLMDPSATLRRGYSITLDENGQALMDARTIGIGKRITTILSLGRIMSLVQDKEQV
jgi:exonuclease VII large subunit